MKSIVGAAAFGLVLLVVAVSLLSGEDAAEPAADAPQSSLLDDIFRRSSTTSPSISSVDAGRVDPTEAGAPDDGPTGPITTAVVGPFLVAEDALGDPSAPSHQERVFRTADGTVAVLYHRPGGEDGQLQEIVLTHSHDGGSLWHGELKIGLEAAEASYSGVMDPAGNINVAYGRDAPGAAGGAIKVRTLRTGATPNHWEAGPEHRVVWDWPGTGASVPTLELFGERLWLAYRAYDEEGYSIAVRSADPDAEGEFPQERWSNPYFLTSPAKGPRMHASLIAHEFRMSAIYTTANREVRWRVHRKPLADAPSWTVPQVLLEADEDSSEPSFAHALDAAGNLQVAINREGLFVAHLEYDGRAWTRLRQLAVNSVFAPAVSTDGENVWAIWKRRLPSGSSRLEVKRWLADRGWERGTVQPWPDDYGAASPSLVVYRASGRQYIDVTRYVISRSASNGGRGASVSGFLERPGDILYVSHDRKFDFAPFSFAAGDEESSPPLFEYWDGFAWAPLQATDGATESLRGGPPRVERVRTLLPIDWEPTTVDDVTGYYLRLQRSAAEEGTLEALNVRPPLQISGPYTASAPNGVVDIVWSVQPGDSGTGPLWYGGASLAPMSDTGDVGNYSHGNELISTGAAPPQVQGTSPLPPGSPRQYVSPTLDVDEAFEYQLLDGQVRQVTVRATDLGFRSPGKVTVWATATIEVAGPGVPTETAEIAAAYFQSPVVLNGVRIYVETTKEFNDFRLGASGPISKAARLMLSDARHTLTDPTQYRWPFPGYLWGLGPVNRFFQGIVGSTDSHSHVDGFEQSMPSDTPVNAWTEGEFALSFSGGGEWAVALRDTPDGEGSAWHRALDVGDVDLDRAGGEVQPGDRIATVTDSSTPVRWGSESSYDWAPLLAEWYVAGASPIERSYVKDWLVLGPYDQNPDSIESALDVEYIPNETNIRPSDGDAAPEDFSWRRFDAIVPGVVDVAEALSLYPNSGWARVTGNSPFSVAYLATYVYSPDFREVRVSVGSSDAVKVWVGPDELIRSDAQVRVKQSGDWSILPDSRDALTSVLPGWNRVLIKLSQGRTGYSRVRRPQNAWQLTFRISDPAGNPSEGLVISPEQDPAARPLANYALLATDPSRIVRAEPPAGRHDWPDAVDLKVGERYVHALSDGSERTLTLLSYDVIIPMHKVEATVEVSGGGSRETHTLEVALGGVPVAINGLRLYAYAWKEANDFGFENAGISGAFPLTSGQDVGFAVNNAEYPLFPSMDSYTFPVDTAFYQGGDFQSFLEPSAGTAHAGYDIAAPDAANLVAMQDGVVWYKKIASSDPRTLGQGIVSLSTTSGDEYDDPWTWFWSHVQMDDPRVPNGTFVKKGTVLFEGVGGKVHMGSRYSLDFGSWLFAAEVWNWERRNDFPSPRYWLALGPYPGSMSNDYISEDEGADIPDTILPRRGQYDDAGERAWRFSDNFVTGIVGMGELLSVAPFSDYLDKRPTDSVGYAATYVYSPEDHTDDEDVWLLWGSSSNAKVWLNGTSVIDTPGAPGINGDPIVLDDERVPLPLKAGWNSLIVKTAIDEGPWLFSPKIGDTDGNRISGLVFSTRDIGLKMETGLSEGLDLTWSTPDFHGTKVDTYMLDVALDPGFAGLIIDDFDLGKVNSHTLTGLAPGVDYYVRVKPFNYSDLGGRVYWQHMDSVQITAGNLTVRSPRDGDSLTGARIPVDYTVEVGDTDASQIRFRLDGSEDLIETTADGSFILTEVAPGTHELTAWLTNPEGAMVPGSETTTSFVTAAAPKHADARSSGWLHVEGNRLIDESGSTVLLRGANVENWQWIWDGVENKLDAIEFERRGIPILTGSSPTGWGANIIHLDVAAEPIITQDPDYLGALDEMISLAKVNGAYTMLSMRYTGLLEEPSSPTQISEDGVAALSERYGTDSSVIYVVGSEPRNVTWEGLKPRLTSMIDAIRTNSPQALIAVPGTEWSRYVDGNLDDPIERENIMLHVSAFDTWEIIQSGSATQQPYRLGEVSAEYPVVLGGFGVREEPVPGENFWMTDIADLEQLLDFSELHGMSWTAWVFNSVACPCMLEDTESFEPTPFGLVIRDRLMAAGNN